MVHAQNHFDTSFTAVPCVVSEFMQLTKINDEKQYNGPARGGHYKNVVVLLYIFMKI